MLEDSQKIIEERKAHSVLNLLTEIGEMMITSGAHTARIIRNLERIAKGLGYNCELVLTYTGIVISVYKQNKFKAHTLAKTIKTKGLNFETISEISILSWDVLENKISIDEIKSTLKQIKAKKVYSDLQLYALVPLASVALCILFDGDWLQSIIVYFSTLFGYYARRSMMLKHHNHMVAFFIGATISTLFIHFMGVFCNIQVKEALVVSVLYLIPGAVMINSFIDYLEGYFESGTARLIYSLMLVLMIAFGFLTSTMIFNMPFVTTLNQFDFSVFQLQIKEALEPQGLWIEISKFIFGGITSLGFALMFNTPRRALWTVFLLGALGYLIKFMLIKELDMNLTLSIFAASSFVGISGIYFAHRAHTPPIIFMIPAVINMIPGLLSYEFMMGMIDWISGGKGQKPSVEEVIQTFSYGISTVFILFALAFGVAFPVVVFKSYTVKGKDLNVMIKKLFVRNN
ncbi:threonine/serine exporter family protein [Flavobacterium franklandianum]|uniref:threonine/serine ThrE exporter family protein n=1 Tax=Flavobacterium franklandianum TaxID=2594430 RepID=UPI00117B0712|nr:threonine/serine exporter family protein [Flavobacterium franklandianum]TRX29685.1 threonine/serine exporter family protein [Flavobacterium franklandianum]